ncbi:MAG: topology modulation protein [Gemmatimonadetes bacterium]|nr:topology modulation protein [Gemmatimonadota bacterium]
MSAEAVRRVLVIGSGGAGKSRLAAQIAERLSLPLVRLDALYWHAGWVPTPKEEWNALVRELSAADAWVMDGNYGGTLPLRLERCDAVVFLDLPRLVCMWGLVSRWLRYRGRTRPDLAAGCPERMSWEFIVWVWSYPSRRRGEILAKLGALPPSKRVTVLTSRRAARRFVDGLGLGLRASL